MKKKFMKITAVALCAMLAFGTLAACGTKVGNVPPADVDVYAYVGGTMSAKLTNSGENRITDTDGTLRVDVAANVTEVEFDLARFFENNDGYLGKNFYFTRDDVKKADGTRIKGYAWVQVGGTSSNRLYKKLGFEDDDTVTPMNKNEIAALPGHEGESRMYIITDGGQAGKHIVYIDSTTASSVETGETRVTFRLHGDNSKNADLKILVNKAE